MSDLPSQNVLLVSGVGEYMSSLLLILSITLLFAWLTVWQLPRFFPRSVKTSNGSTPDPLEHGTTSPENPQKEDEKKEDKKEEKKDKKKAKKEKGYPIEAIEGIGVVYGRRLKRLGIYSTLDLLNKASSAVGREELAAQSKVSTRKILEWVNRADLMRVPGIGEEYSDLLGMAGVKSALALRLSVPIILLDRMREINNEKKLVRRLPSLDDVTAWVVAAVEMESRVVD
jgi:predicted flap endonuclease-1-like 5' DNA nuclease